MNLLTTKRVLTSGITNFLRNIWISIAATSMVSITLFIISTIIVLYALTSVAIDNSTDKVGVVTAYFNPNATEREKDNVIIEVKSLPGVKDVIYTTKEEAIEQFRQNHQDQPSWIESIDEFTTAEDSPLNGSLSVKANDLSDYPAIYETLTGDRYEPYFQDVRDNQEVIDKLYAIIMFITRFGILLAGIFMVVTVLVTFNTIRLTIYNRRSEVEIMRLVGATNWYIRWPFFIEGILYAMIATILISGVVLGLLFLLSGRIQEFLSPGSTLSSNLVSSLFWQVLAANFLASIGLTVLASSIAMRKYLKV
jgi:cell division transport system permease protein